MCGDDESGIDLWCTSDEYLLSYSESVHERGKAEASKKNTGEARREMGYHTHGHSSSSFQQKFFTIILLFPFSALKKQAVKAR